MKVNTPLSMLKCQGVKELKTELQICSCISAAACTLKNHVCSDSSNPVESKESKAVESKAVESIP